MIRVSRYDMQIGVTDLRARLEDLLRSATHRWIARRVNEDTVLLAQLNAATRHLATDAKTLERIHTVLHGEKGRLCARGERKPFAKLGGGWRFCARQCACQRENLAAKLSTLASTRDAETKARIRDKANATSRAKGHADAASAARAAFARKRSAGEFDETAAAAKRTATVQGRYGVQGVLSDPEIAAKKTATMLARYGVEHAMQCPKKVERATTTHLARYGGPDRMAHARPHRCATARHLGCRRARPWRAADGDRSAVGGLRAGFLGAAPHSGRRPVWFRALRRSP